MQKNVAARYPHWAEDLKDAQCRLSKNMDIVNRLISGILINIEDSDNQILGDLDRYSGVDLINILDDNQMRGVASRIQKPDGRSGYPYNSFTIRYERHTGTATEYSKRMKAIENGYFYPQITFQGYVDTNDIIVSAGAIKTDRLYCHIKEHPEDVRRNRSDNDFIYVLFDDLRISGVKIYEELT